MTDNTQPEALRLADWLDGCGGLTSKSAAAELRRQHALIAELNDRVAKGFDAADMATASAQGFRDGVASVAANAGSEPVGYWDGEFSKDGGATIYEVPQVSAFGRKYGNTPSTPTPLPQREWWEGGRTLPRRRRMVRTSFFGSSTAPTRLLAAGLSALGASAMSMLMQKADGMERTWSIRSAKTSSRTGCPFRPRPPLPLIAERGSDGCS